MSEMLEVVPAGSFCWNEECSLFGKVGAGNIRRNGKTRKGVQRFQCKACKKVFAATRGTPFYGVHDPEKMLLALAMLCERSSLRGVQRVTGVKPDTLLGWLEKAAAHVLVIERLLQEKHQVTRAQLDGLWAYVGHKGEKGGTRKRRTGAPSGARERST
jgi:transposase-like protein